MVIWMNDEDQNGFFDTWKYDIDADGIFDREFRMKEDSTFLYLLDYERLHEAYLPVLKNALIDNQRLIEIQKAILKKYEINFY